jgi:hypothetical protein
MKYEYNKIPQEILQYWNVVHLDDLHYRLTPMEGLEPSYVNPILEKYNWPSNVFLTGDQEVKSVRWATMKHATSSYFQVKVPLKQHRNNGPAVVIFRYDDSRDEYSVEERAYLDGYKMNENVVKKMKINAVKNAMQ